MGKDIDRITSKVRPKLKAIMATRHFYSLAGMVKQFRAHILGLLEFSSLAIFHAAPGHLGELDALMDPFCGFGHLACRNVC